MFYEENIFIQKFKLYFNNNFRCEENIVVIPMKFAMDISSEMT